MDHRILLTNLIFLASKLEVPTLNKICYYIDRCELWGFIREINSGISHVTYQFFPAGTTFTQL